MAKAAFAIAAHPDDIEFLMSGTLMLLVRRAMSCTISTWPMAVAAPRCTISPRPPVCGGRRPARRPLPLARTFHEKSCYYLEIFYEQGILRRPRRWCEQWRRKSC